MNKTPTLMSVIDSIPACDDSTYQWGDRSSITACILALIGKVPVIDRRVILEDVIGLLSIAETQPVPGFDAINDPKLEPTPEPTQDKYADQRPWDGPFEGNPNKLNYETKDHCDTCNSNMDCSKPKKLGIMFHARGATGRVCPVLFVCHDCLAKDNSTCLASSISPSPAS